MIRNFSAEEWYREWKYISAIFLGETKLSDVALRNEGEKFPSTRCELWHSMPDYSRAPRLQCLYQQLPELS